jgi:peptide/nickel transport system substrate-binding protein
MNERHLRSLVALVKAGKMSRRVFVRTMVELGLTAPLASQMLAFASVAAAQSKSEYKPTRRGGGGALKLLWWQGPTLLNPHFAVGTKDQEASRIFYEPLAGWDADGNLMPMLAAEIPDLENGGLARDGMSVTWKLKPNVRWHDGKPFTVDDVVFTSEYASDPATAAVSIGSYKDAKVEKIDPLTVRVLFAKPTPYWANAFVGWRGMIIPKHLFEPFKGARRAGESEAGRNRAVSVRLLQPGRPGHGRAQSRLPRAKPAALRHDRDEGRRRRRLGRPCRAADRRVRFCVEHPGRGRDPAAAGEGRQGAR